MNFFFFFREIVTLASIIFFSIRLYICIFLSRERISLGFFLFLIQMHFTRRSAKVYLSKCKTDAWDLSFFFALVSNISTILLKFHFLKWNSFCFLYYILSNVSYFRHWNFDEKSCFAGSFFTEWNEWRNTTRIKFSTQNFIVVKVIKKRFCPTFSTSWRKKD